ncbi:low molecular weight protein-tyrosine-phosphatase [Streptomyces sp. PT12]|uniref:low molecular weight protein-tyrosine-phosphatase n=1 Tax=Streptomyces sp. PT12 TaxID=1510197 RepID=UPI000DE36BEF|nr:low molecular weight protein-tyrosine-phosphatase [Streptomyces sp. PT12]RBM05540.1 protein tyrosine phosphatase [Streptomyces sp. PT12]
MTTEPSPDTYRVCFVCSGNICRSPMAEVVLRARLDERGLGGRVAVDSAGTGDWHAGDPADPRAWAALDEAGYAVGPHDHAARWFDPGWFGRYDLIVALDRGHERALRRLAPTAADAAKVRLLLAGPEHADDPDVPDPYYGDDAGFAACLSIIEGGMPDVLETIDRALAGRVGPT